MPAFNPYFPIGYQPYQNQFQQPFYQQNQMPTQNPVPGVSQMQTQGTIGGINWVSSEKEAAMFPIAANSAVALWNSGEPVVYLKQADASGKPTMKTYDLVERAETRSEPHDAAQGQEHSFATKDDLSAIVASIRGLNDSVGGANGEIASIRADIESLKRDMYGIAGNAKKKSANAKIKFTNAEETEDDEQ